MSGLVIELALVVVLVAVNAVFSGSELALLSLREGQISRLRAEGRRGTVLHRLLQEPNRFLATIQIGITLAGFLASATAAVSIAKVLTGPLSFLGGAAEPVAIVVVTLLLSYLTLVFGELVPKRLAMQRSESWSLRVARPLDSLARLTRPIVWMLSRSTDLVVRLLGADPSATRDELDDDEIRALIATSMRFTPHQRRIISGAFEIAERRLRVVLRPRLAVIVLDAATPCADAAATLISTGHTRAPVVHGDLDHVTGIVSLADLVGHDDTVGDHVRAARHLPESATVLDALHDLQSSRQQMAIVLNEYGGAEGIVTVEDLLEELVGEIYDDGDLDLLTVRREPDGSMVLPGSFPIHDLGDLGVALPSGEYATVAGLVLRELGHIPEAPGERVSLPGWDLTVLAVEKRAIVEVRLSPADTGAGVEGSPD